MSCEHKMIDLPLSQLDQFSDLKSYLIYYLKVNTLLNNVHSRMDSTKLSLFPTFSLQIHKVFELVSHLKNCLLLHHLTSKINKSVYIVHDLLTEVTKSSIDSCFRFFKTVGLSIASLPKARFEGVPFWKEFKKWTIRNSSIAFLTINQTQTMFAKSPHRCKLLLFSGSPLSLIILLVLFLYQPDQCFESPGKFLNWTGFYVPVEAEQWGCLKSRL